MIDASAENRLSLSLFTFQPNINKNEIFQIDY
jgi:hypothetical protein